MASVKTLPISQKLRKINESKALQKQIEELKKEELILTEGTQPWYGEALQLSQVIDEKI